jgi:hypothetical protein
MNYRRKLLFYYIGKNGGSGGIVKQKGEKDKE